MRIIYTGDRHWSDPHTVYSVLTGLQEQFPGHTVVHGAAKGADRHVNTIAKRLGLPIEPHPADWNAYGRRAGYVRNAEMAKLGAGLVVGFKADIDTTLLTGGTEMMIRLALKAGIPAVLFPMCCSVSLVRGHDPAYAVEHSLQAMLTKDEGRWP